MCPFKRKKQYGLSSFEIKSYKPFSMDDFGNGGHMSNFAMIIPEWPIKPYEPPKPSKWQRFLCKILGHRYRIYMITTFDSEMPYKCKRCQKFRPRKEKS